MSNRHIDKILLKKSGVVGKIPTQLELGELAINFADVILYASGTTSNSILPIGWNRVAKTGDTMTGTLYAPSISATTISAVTYYNLPLDVYVTGGTFYPSSKQLIYTRNDNGTIPVTLPFSLFYSATTITSGNTFTTIDTITGITDNTNLFITSYITAYKDTIDYGFWKRTLALNKVSGVLQIIGENSDFDRISSGLTPNQVVYSINGGNLDIKISGETAKTYTWSSNWEITK